MALQIETSASEEEIEQALSFLGME
jgi:hypothetical protein